MILFINYFRKASVLSVCAVCGTAQQLEDRCDKNKMNPNHISRALLSNISGIKTGVLCRDLQKYSVISLVGPSSSPEYECCRAAGARISAMDTRVG